MTVEYNVIARKNPQDLTAAPKYYASLASKGAYDLKDLIQRIVRETSLGRGDVTSVIETFVELVPEILGEGHIVKLGNMGSFQLYGSSEGSDTEAEVSSNNIKKVSMRFRPSKEITNKLKTFKFEKKS
jgi:predicted histone-like DNA-binding protein